MGRAWGLVVVGIVPAIFAGTGCDSGTASPDNGSLVTGGSSPSAGTGGATAPSTGSGGNGGGAAGAGPGGTSGAAGTTGAAGGAPPTGAAGGPGGTTGTAGAGGLLAFGCPALFDQAVLQDYNVEISADEWGKLDHEFRNRAAALAAGQNDSPYHPVVFHSGGETVTDAQIRLKGDSSWNQTVALDGANAKMQFVIAFDRVNSKGAFHGVSKLVLDMPRDDASFLDERLAFNALPTMLGRPAPCANSARLSINGQYYGLYSNEEHVGHSYIKRIFPEAPDADLLKGGWVAETNDPPNSARMNIFWGAHDIGAMAAIVDMDWSVTEWAAEALLNDADGYYGGDHNFFIYDYPGTGYRWLVCDADSSFDWFGYVNEHPIYWWIAPRTEHYTPAQHYMIVMQDPTWRARYIAAIRTLLDKWDVATLQGWIDAWSAQIADSVAADPHKAVTVGEHLDAVTGTRDEVVARPAFLTKFLGCEDGTGDVTDADGDGAPWCNDCDDGNAAAHPGAAEICGNAIDDDCDGFVDNGCPGH